MALFFRDATLIFGPIFNIGEYATVPPGSAFSTTGDLSESLSITGAANIPGIET